MSDLTLTFLGGVETVTGSKALVETEGARVMVDCGLFQGLKDLRLRNWAPLPVTPVSIDAVVLTHAHIDHSGYIPLLVKNGFSGPIHATEATTDLCGVLLPDSGFLHERDAEYANRKGFSKHRPALPLYTEEDATDSLHRFKPLATDEPREIAPGLALRFRPGGHILGAAQAMIEGEGIRVLFSGDLGRPHDPVMRPPAPGEAVTHLIVESTYGGRSHNHARPDDLLAEVINRTAGRGGTVLIPSFAVGRAQLLMYYLRQLKDEKRIPNLPMFLDSPMAIDASELFRRHHALHHLNAEQARRTCDVVTYVHTAEESKELDQNHHHPKVIISASGMATGGRVLHHLKQFVTDNRNTVLFAGYQAPGTRGAAMLDGAEEIKIHGDYFKVAAEVLNLDMLSAHADEDEIIDWLRTFPEPPRETFINHGEPKAADSLRNRINEELGWTCRIPKYLDRFSLT